MDLLSIKIALPHVEKIWVLNGEWYIHFVVGSEEILLTEETLFREVPEAKNKKKSNGIK